MLTQRQRETVLPRLDRIVRRLGLYTAYQLSELESVGETWLPLGVHDALEACGYELNGLAAAKRHPDDRDRVDDGSFRKVPEEHPDVNAAITEDWRPEECQFHVHVFATDRDDVVEVFSHYEVRPDLFAPAVDFERLREHYRPTWGATYLLGEACDDVREITHDP